jgi:hypothetical protein
MARKQVYWEEVEVGQEIPTLVKHPTTVQLAKWAGASGDYNPIHYDKDFAIANHLPGPIVHGRLTFAFLSQLVTDWIGEEGTLKKIGVSFRGMHGPITHEGEDHISKGKVTQKYMKNGEHYIGLEIRAESPRGEVTTPGTAVVVLPSKAK